jgi:uncharacterized protein DUF5624
MTPRESSELVDLFTTYTAAPDSIGSHLSAAAADRWSNRPLLVATATDLALYPGGGTDPEVLGFRMSTRGFKELAAVSHLGPALASLVALHDLDPAGVWRADAMRLLARTRRARAANDLALWRDGIAVETYRGREETIVAMVDHALAETDRYLERILADPGDLTFDTLRRDVLEDGAGPVSLDRVMIATFFLVGLDISHRLIAWLDDRDLDWSQVMVLIAGKQGRPTAGVTLRTNSVASMVLAASRFTLPLDSLYLAPHAPTFPTPVGGDLAEVRAIETPLRDLWAGTRAVVGLSRDMFPGSPPFAPEGADTTRVDGSTTTLADLPAVTAPDDWPALVARLRLVMEDPRQLLSGAVSDYAARELAARGNDPSQVTVPGLDGEPYPLLTEAATR